MESVRLTALPERVSLLGVAKFLAVLAQLGLLVILIRSFSIESEALVDISILTFFGFLIHSFLPYRYRHPFFLLLSLAGIGIVLGLSAGAWLVAMGIVLIGICHLPVPFFARVLMLLSAGALLAALRIGWIPSPSSAAIWPILGSMFMFRLIIYLYDLKYEKTRPTFSSALSYFFLLPNVCFPLFPVVDYKTFRRTYYDSDPYDIYQTGVHWMFRGLTHLLLYRYIYQNLTIAPSEVTNAGDLVQFLVSNFLLYLRVSGQFHLVIGMLHLFGFNLPETHRRYYLASSFTDFWRRINIYWKDFMMKIFYYPAFFKMRKWGKTKAFVLSTLIVFFATWLLHSYQWFWLRGSFPITWQDALFWGILAVLVVWNSLYEAKHGRERTLGLRSWTFGSFAGRALRTAGCFAVICILWSLWTSESLFQWLSLWSFAGDVRMGNMGQISLLFVAAIGFNGNSRTRTPAGSLLGKIGIGYFQRSAILTGTFLLLLYVIGRPEVYSRLGSNAADVIESLRKEQLSRQDDAMLERGYYENLLSVHRFNSQLWEVYMKKPADWDVDLHQLGVMRYTGDFLKEEFVPLSEIKFKGAMLHTNRWGLRDKDYEKNKPPNTYRIALLGSSHTMGWGVADGVTFETVLEDRLNSEKKLGKYDRYEILNFAVPSYKPLQQVFVLEKRVFSFEPDAVFYVAHSNDENRLIELMSRKQHRPHIPYNDLKEIHRRLGINTETAEVIAEKKLRPFGAEMLSWAYRRIVQDCRQRAVLPVWIYLPTLAQRSDETEALEQVRMAQEAGFITLNLFGVYENINPTSIRLAEWDDHPNARGHKLVADRLYNVLSENRQLISLIATRMEPKTDQPAEERE